jgi:hypothetical protein
VRVTKLKKIIIIDFFNSAVNLQGGEPIFNLENEKLGDKQRHFIGRSYEEFGVVLGLGKVMRENPKPDAYKVDFVVPVKRFT